MKLALAVAADVLSVICAVWLAFMLRLGVLVGFDLGLTLFAAVAVPLTIGVFAALGVYKNVVRFSGPFGLAQIGGACLLVMIPLILVFGIANIFAIPRTISVIFPMLLFLTVSVNRIVARYILFDMHRPLGERKRVLIYGAEAVGRQLASSIQHEPEYQLVAYVDSNPRLTGKRIEGVPIHPADDLDDLVRRQAIEIVFLAMTRLSRERRARIVERLQKSGVHVLTTPALSEIIDGKVSVSDLREIDVTDLLSRSPIKPDPVLLSGAIAGKVVLVTGAGGSIGAELSRQIVGLDPERVVLVEMTESALYQIDVELRALALQQGVELDIVPELASVDKRDSVRRIFERHRPHTIYHAAAYKHVPMVEANVVSGVANNIRGTYNCAVAACQIGAERFILVSTDKAVRPTNVMGASKRVCEMVLQALSTQDCPTVFSMVRFGNVLGSSGSVVPRFREQIARGGPVSVTHPDITRYFMTIPEAAELVIQAGAMAEGGEVYLLEMGEPVKIIDLARTMIRLSGRTVRDADNPDGDIAIVETGLRPGEKLYEELLISAEAQPTQHPRIFRAREDHMPWAELDEQLARIDRLAQAGDAPAIRARLRELVPGYTPREEA